VFFHLKAFFPSTGGFGLLYDEIHSKIKVRFMVKGIFRVCWLSNSYDFLFRV
jgi:hypothetical protein